MSVIIGEGGSGGALAIAVANRVLMLEHSIYSVASPEACASILWRSREKAQVAADELKLTAQSLLKLKLIDRILEEPLGGAHRTPHKIIDKVGKAILEELALLEKLSGADLSKARKEKFLEMGRNLA